MSKSMKHYSEDLKLSLIRSYYESGQSKDSYKKKIWGQAALELASEREQKISVVCRLFGHCRQAFYQLQTDLVQKSEHERRVIESVKETRAEDCKCSWKRGAFLMRSCCADRREAKSATGFCRNRPREAKPATGFIKKRKKPAFPTLGKVKITHFLCFSLERKSKSPIFYVSP